MPTSPLFFPTFGVLCNPIPFNPAFYEPFQPFYNIAWTFMQGFTTFSTISPTFLLEGGALMGAPLSLAWLCRGGTRSFVTPTNLVWVAARLLLHALPILYGLVPPAVRPAKDRPFARPGDAVDRCRIGYANGCFQKLLSVYRSVMRWKLAGSGHASTMRSTYARAARVPVIRGLLVAVVHLFGAS